MTNNNHVSFDYRIFEARSKSNNLKKNLSITLSKSEFHNKRTEFSI